MKPKTHILCSARGHGLDPDAGKVRHSLTSSNANGSTRLNCAASAYRAVPQPHIVLFHSRGHNRPPPQPCAPHRHAERHGVRGRGMQNAQHVPHNMRSGALAGSDGVMHGHTADSVADLWHSMHSVCDGRVQRGRGIGRWADKSNKRQGPAEHTDVSEWQLPAWYLNCIRTTLQPSHWLFTTQR